MMDINTERGLRAWCIEIALKSAPVYQINDILGDADKFYAFVTKTRETAKKASIPHAVSVNINLGEC